MASCLSWTRILLAVSVLINTTASAPAFSFSQFFGDDDNDTPVPAVQSTTATATQGSTAGSSSSSSYTIGSSTSAISTIESTYANWVGPSSGPPPDTACYREAHIGDTCPQEFTQQFESCWAECPLKYPVRCGVECIRQSDTCALEVVTKVAVLAQVATAYGIFKNIYGDFKKMTRGVQIAIRCAKEMAVMVRNISKYVRGVKASDPQTSQAKLLAMLYQTDNIVYDLPITIRVCLGHPVKPIYRLADKITNTAELVVKEVLTNANTITSSWTAFKAFMHRVSLGASLKNLTSSDITSLKSALKSNTSCGYDMKRLADRTWMTVLDLRKHHPEMSEEELRVNISNSNLVLRDIPIATNNCMSELIAQSDEKTAYSTRTTLRQTFSVIVEDLIKSGTSNNGSLLSAEQYAYTIADKALTFYAVWDITGTVATISEYFQSICGPTKFIGEIDDGSADKALGLTTVGGAFKNSSGYWTKRGDGVVSITFESSDTENVQVDLHSAGQKIDEVSVAAGKTVTWTSNTTALGGKTLYLDRWRPGFLDLPGTGGGTLLLWVPRSPSGGNLQLKAKLNMS